MSEIAKIAVIGSGAMGRGIAQSAVLAGYPVVLNDLSQDLVQMAREKITQSIDKGVEQGKTTPENAQAAAARLTISAELADSYEADLVIEAIPENLDLKRSLFAASVRLPAQRSVRVR